MSSKSIPPTIFDSFNARALEPEDVARTFIPPDHYSDVLKRAHTLVVGPRGSGKTTILKMLQAPALENWKSPIAGDYRERIDFTGVFIPADRSWSEQINALGEGKLSEEHQRLFGIAAFTTHVLRALIEAMQYRVHPPDDPSLIPHRRVQLSRPDESELVMSISEQWHAPIKIPSLLSLKQALTTRLSTIWEISSKESLLEEKDRGDRLADIEFLHLNFLRSSGVAIELFDDVTNQSRRKWGLLFDELELAPAWIREELIKALRSVNSQLLFKLSMSPYSEDANLLHQSMSATFGNDYNQVALWYAHKEEGYTFCRDLFASMLRDRGLPDIAPQKVFGWSEFETLREEYSSSVTAYRYQSNLQQKFERMSEKDSSFRKFLEDKNVDIRHINLLSEDERAASVRKVRSLLAVREAYRPAEGTVLSQKQERRGRKNPKLYRGALSLFAMVEGNPRWFIGIVGVLVDEYAKTQHKIPANRQGIQVTKAVNRFRAFLRTIPCPVFNKKQQPRGVLTILDLIGNYFHSAVVSRDFSPDPPLSFTIDSRSDDALLDSLGRALNAGAIVYVKELDSDAILKTLRGKRFRLSYLLASHYGIPLILGQSISLSFIMNARLDSSTIDENQDSLFS